MTSGATYERQLVRALTETDEWAAMRCPTSGGGTTRDLPDVLALRGERVDGYGNAGDRPVSVTLAIELKTTRATCVYVDGEEVESLKTFAERAGATPLIGAKFKRPGKRTPFYLVDPADCRLTPEGNYGVPVVDPEERARFEVWTATETKPPRFERVD